MPTRSGFDGTGTGAAAPAGAAAAPATTEMSGRPKVRGNQLRSAASSEAERPVVGSEASSAAEAPSAAGCGGT